MDLSKRVRRLVSFDRTCDSGSQSRWNSRGRASQVIAKPLDSTDDSIFSRRRSTGCSAPSTVDRSRSATTTRRVLSSTDGRRCARLCPASARGHSDPPSDALPGAALESPNLPLRRCAVRFRWSARTRAARQLSAIAEAAASAAGMALVPDVCIINYYRQDGRLGLHQIRLRALHQ